MGIDFKTKDVIHRISVKFTKAYLPQAKKPYNLKAVHQPVLDIHGIASKADVYNMTTNPRIIEEGLKAGLELINYLVADGYRIKTPLFTLGLKFPGEYSGTEISLADGKFPEAKLSISRELRNYLKQNVIVEFDGFDLQSEGMIAEVRDEATGLVSQTLTRGNVITIGGYGLKIESDPEHENQVGVFFTPPSGKGIKAVTIPVNKPRKLMVVVPPEVKAGVKYTITIGTMSSPKGGTLLKTVRSFSSKFQLAA